MLIDYHILSYEQQMKAKEKEYRFKKEGSNLVPWVEIL